MENFVNYITDTINPTIINDYISGPGTSDEFVGSDPSTADYTKMGWIMSCYRRMKEANTVDQAVKDVINQLSGYSDSNGVKNYALLSPSGFNLAQQMVYDNKSVPDFSFTDSKDIITGFSSYLDDNVGSAQNSGGQSALHMIIDLGMADAIPGLITSYGTQSTDAETSSILSPYYLALKKKSEDEVSGITSRSTETFLAIQSTLGSPGYNEFNFSNAILSGSSGDVKNEVVRYILGVSHDVLKSSIVSSGITSVAIGSIASETSDVIAALASSVTTSDGIAASKVVFDSQIYLSATSHLEGNKGYSPLMYYINKYRSEVDIDILTSLSTVFSPLAISVDETATTEGFNPVGLMAYYMTVNEDGITWGSPAGASFIKTALTIEGESAYRTWAMTGNVRDFTGGASSNAFGAITNILTKINSSHQAWWNAIDKEANPDTVIHDYSSTYDILAALSLPSVIDYAFYTMWMTEYGKELT